MKNVWLTCLTAGAAALYFGTCQSASANFFVIPVSKDTSASCTGAGVVESAGQCWMDRNLGASRVAESPTDEAAYGDLYQWGRLGDGHQNRSSTGTEILSENDVPGHSNFIVSADSPYDWRTPHNDSLWQGLGGVNNPCPQGFRLPTIEEWETEMNSWTSTNADGAFSSPLKLTSAGSRLGRSNVIEFIGERGYYWSSTLSAIDDDDGADRLVFTAEIVNVGPNTNDRAGGLSIRCIRE